jgi:hypothetical protein
MTLSIELVDEPAEQTAQECHAQISITAGAKGLELEAACINEPQNPAVKFAKWVCEHGQELFLRMVQEEARTRIQAPREVRIVGTDGETLQ